MKPPVSSQVLLKDVDALLYVDTDVLFLRPMDDIWSLFKSFNSSQLAAMAPEHEVPKIGWYSRFARHPFYGLMGVNSGVMLMNLTRIRRTAFKVSSPRRPGWRRAASLPLPRAACCRGAAPRLSASDGRGFALGPQLNS